MMITLSPFMRRFLAVSILGLVLFTIWVGLLDPLSDYWGEAGRDNERSHRLLSAYQTVIKEEPQWQNMLQSMKEGKYANIFVEESDQNLAAAKFQTDVKQVVEKNGGSIKSIQVLPITSEHNLQRINVHVNFTIPVESMPSLLKQTDHTKPSMFLNNFMVTSQEAGQEAITKPVLLLVSSDFYAYKSPVTP